MFFVLLLSYVILQCLVLTKPLCNYISINLYNLNVGFSNLAMHCAAERGDVDGGGEMMQHPMRAPGPPGGQPPTQSPMTAQMAPPTGPAMPGPPQPGGGPAPRQPGPLPAATRPPNNQQLLSQTCQPQQKQNRITSIQRPLGLDPLLILQERENRFVFVYTLCSCCIDTNNQKRLNLKA